MPQAAHPIIADVQALYAAAGLIPDPAAAPFASVPWAAHLASAVQSFAVRTGRRYPAAAGTRSYDPPVGARGILPLGQDLASDGGGAITVTARGTLLQSGRDYFLGPDNADSDGRPWAWVEIPNTFGIPQVALVRKSIAITGLWGGSALVPDDVWEAERQYAAALCVPEVSLTISSGLYKIEDVQYGGSDQVPLSAQANMWKAHFESVVQSRLRVSSYLG